MLDTATLNALLLEAFNGKTTWLEASRRYPVETFIEAFYSTRTRMESVVAGLTDEQAAYISPAHPIWSISETVTHLIYTQAFYYNKLLDITTSQLPHIVEAAQGFGEGAKQGVPVAILHARLVEATQFITTALTDTRAQANPEKIENSPLFGPCAYQTWVLLLLGHEVDHVRQASVMRRLARAALP